MKKILFIILVISLVVPGVLRAQGGYTAIGYVMGFGTGDLGDYVSKASFRGAVFEYQKEISSKMSAGFELGWNTFYEKKDYDTYTIESASLSGVQYRYSNNFPMLATVEYNLKPDEMIRPYVNFGLGTMYSRRDLDMGVWTVQETAWHFAIKPEIGALFEINPGLAFKFAAKYHVGFKASGLETQSYLALNFGLAFVY